MQHARSKNTIAQQMDPWSRIMQTCFPLNSSFFILVVLPLLPCMWSIRSLFGCKFPKFCPRHLHLNAKKTNRSETKNSRSEGIQKNNTQTYSNWWFHFIFHCHAENWGHDPFLTQYVSNGLIPPTKYLLTSWTIWHPIFPSTLHPHSCPVEETISPRGLACQRASRRTGQFGRAQRPQRPVLWFQPIPKLVPDMMWWCCKWQREAHAFATWWFQRFFIVSPTWEMIHFE